MPRTSRYHFPGATYHVMLRGNAGEPIFFSNKDRIRLCLLIQQGVERYHHHVLAYCFMQNHVHFAIRVYKTPLSSIMHNLSFRYTQYINSEQKRSGHLFQGRFKAILIDSSSYLKELIRYIHLNPVRASIAKHPEEYQWSSHNSYLGHDPITWLHSSYVLSQFNSDKMKALHLFNNFVNYEAQSNEMLDFKKGLLYGIIGNKSFIEQLQEHTEIKQKIDINIPHLIQTACTMYNIDKEKLLGPRKNRQASHIRTVLALLVQETKGVTLQELAQHLRREPSSLSQLLSRLTTNQDKLEKIKIESTHLKERLCQMSECQA